MAYFTNSQGYLFLCSDIPFEEKQKLDDYLQLLEESGVGKIIEENHWKNIWKKVVVLLIIHTVCLPLFSMPSPNIPAVCVVLKTV